MGIVFLKPIKNYIFNFETMIIYAIYHFKFGAYDLHWRKSRRGLGDLVSSKIHYSVLSPPKNRGL